MGVTNGLFITTLDFGPGVFDGSTRSLEIGVRTNGNATNAYTVLSPRQTLTSVPYAIQSLNALNASNAVILTAPLPATNMVGTIPNSLLSPNVAVLTNNVIFSGSVTATNYTGNGYGLSNVPGTSLIGIITGNGSGLSNVPAISLTGTLPDVRLSANVALQSNPNLSFAGTVSAANFTVWRLRADQCAGRILMGDGCGQYAGPAQYRLHLQQWRGAGDDHAAVVAKYWRRV